MTKRDMLLDKLNALLIERELPRVENYLVTDDGEFTDVVERDCAQLEKSIYELENPPIGTIPKPPPTTQSLLTRLNLARAQNDMPALKLWKASRLILAQTIARLERTSTKVPVKKCPTRVCKGADTLRKHTSLAAKSKLHEAIKKQRKAEAKELDRITGPDKLKPAAGTKHAPCDSDFITPGKIASDLGIEPRAVRIFLRKHEGDIPADYRDPVARWAFKPTHKAWVMAWIKKGVAS